MRVKNILSLVFVSFITAISVNAQGVIVPIICDVRP